MAQAVLQGAAVPASEGVRAVSTATPALRASDAAAVRPSAGTPAAGGLTGRHACARHWWQRRYGRNRRKSHGVLFTTALLSVGRDGVNVNQPSGVRCGRCATKKWRTRARQITTSVRKLEGAGVLMPESGPKKPPRSQSPSGPTSRTVFSADSTCCHHSPPLPVPTSNAD